MTSAVDSGSFDPFALRPRRQPGAAGPGPPGLPGHRDLPRPALRRRERGRPQRPARPEHYSNHGNFVLEAADGPAPPELITQSDPPEHTVMRSPPRPGFARAAITGAAPLESTAYTIGSTLRQLLADRRWWEALRADPTLLDGVREEGLRHGSAIRWVLRTVVGDFCGPARLDVVW